MVTVRQVLERGDDAPPITMLTAYDAPTAAMVDAAGIDIILVGDSMGNAVLGYGSTLPVTIEETLSHTAAVVRATKKALVVADMPFLSYGASLAEGVRNAGRCLKEAGARAVKIESGPHTVELTRTLVDLGIPVMAHLGLTPQHQHQMGLRRQGTTVAAAETILELARAHEETGAFALVLEHVPENLAARITKELAIPTIGIGAGPHCDGQVLVITDVLGISERLPPFARAFGDVRAETERAIAAYRDAVRDRTFPGKEHYAHADELDDAGGL